MISTDLRRIVSAMTERPWFHDSETPTSGFKYVHVGDANGPGQTVAQWLLPPDASAIVTLANHADALVALVEAVERLAHDQNQPAVYAVLGALAAVHAVGSAP